MLVAGLMMLSALSATIPSTARADGPLILGNRPIGNYRLDLSLAEDVGPEDIGSTPIVGLNNTASITQYTGPGGNVIIPTVVQYPSPKTGGGLGDIEEVVVSYNVVVVRSIAAGAFQGRTDILSITIPEGVDSIGAGAFSGCVNLTSLYFLGSYLPGNVSDQWLSGASANLSGYSSRAPNISPMGTEYHGLMVYKLAQVTPFKPPAPLTGSVVDANGNSVVGALVISGNSTNTTDADGRFLIMAPVGLNSITISGPNVKTATVAAYVGASGTELGDVPVKLTQSTGDSHAAEGVALMVGVIVVAVVLMAVGMLVARKRMRKG
jgi:hypothetical protein